MALHITSINGMGSSTIVGSNIVNTGMGAEDHMHFAEDFLNFSGTLRPSDFYVYQNSPTGPSVIISPGVAYVRNKNYTTYSLTETKYWRVKNDGIINVNINPNNNSLPRITSVFLAINPAIAPNDNASNVASIVTVDGSNSSSPTPPSEPNDGRSYLRLADIFCAANFTSITNSNITNVHSAFPVAISSRSGTNNLINGFITASISSGDLTIAIKNDNYLQTTPSLDNPVFCFVGGRRLAFIDGVKSAITFSSGYNWFGQNMIGSGNKSYDLYIYVINNGGVPRIGVARVNRGSRASNFELNFITDQNYLARAQGATLNPSDELILVGLINVTSNSSNQFTLVNQVVNDNGFSLIRPQIWTPTVTANNSATVSNVAIIRSCTYFLNGTKITVSGDVQFDLAGSPTVVQFSCPFWLQSPSHPTVVSGLNLAGLGDFFMTWNGSSLEFFNRTVSTLPAGSARRIIFYSEYYIQ